MILGGVSPLVFRERRAEGEPEGLLVLHHGRGADEHDLLPFGDVLDPQRRLHVVTPRAPLQIPGWPGNHWYVVPRVGYPDPDTFRAAFDKLAGFHDELWERTGVGPERTVLGGFSMGSVMSYALGLAGDRPAPAGCSSSATRGATRSRARSSASRTSASASRASSSARSCTRPRRCSRCWRPAGSTRRSRTAGSPGRSPASSADARRPS